MSEDLDNKLDLGKYKAIGEKLISMGLKDQEMRIGHQEGNVEFDTGVDKENLSNLKLIVEQIGWPSKDKVGEVASHAAWLVIQHADLDVEFQEKCLHLMEAANGGTVELTQVAYLTDRVAVNREEKQLYGTQFYRNKRGEIVPRPIRDISGLNKRRKSMGLEPFAKYRDKMQGIYVYPENYKNEMVGPFYKQK